MFLVAICSALLLDHMFGELRRFHPLIGFGNSAIWFEQRFNKVSRPGYAIVVGGLGLLLLVTPWGLAVWLIDDALDKMHWILDITVLYWAIGLNSLRQHVAPIKQALQETETGQARFHLSRIVSRDTGNLDTQQITGATIESTLENGNDSLFAVLFCYLLGGPALVVFYRLINTLDAMWGYRTPRYEYFGKTAAKLDDLLNFVPARLTALSYGLCGNFKQAIRSWRSDACKLASPNAGVVMSAGAGSLNLKLGGPTAYHGKMVDKPWFGGSKLPQIHDLQRANLLVIQSTIVWCVVILVCWLFGPSLSTALFH